MKSMRVSTHMIKMFKLGQFMYKAFRVPFLNYGKGISHNSDGSLRMKRLSTPYELVKFLAVGGKSVKIGGKSVSAKDINDAIDPHYKKESKKAIKAHDAMMAKKNGKKSKNTAKDNKITQQKNVIKSLKAKLAHKSSESNKSGSVASKTAHSASSSESTSSYTAKSEKPSESNSSDNSFIKQQKAMNARVGNLFNN